MKPSLAIAVALPMACLGVTVGPDWSVFYPEVGSPDVNRALRIAAEEVRNDIAEATGFKLDVKAASEAKRPAIYIGAEFAERDGFDLADLKGFDNVVAEKGGSIYLFGRDRPGRDRAKVGELGWTQCVLPSIRAATRFLEMFVGVRFLMPGEVGKEVPHGRNVSVSDGCLMKERPTQMYGAGSGIDRQSPIFMIANGIFGRGTFHTYGGHTYPTACPGDKYFATHPEYFALKKNGRRGLGPTKGQTALCISNPNVEELIVDELKQRFDEGAEVCELGQHDGTAVCGCEECKAFLGTGDDWGEKFWLFHRRIAERMMKERPGKVVQILSYAATTHPPKTFKVFPPNVMVEMCKYGEDAFKEWRGYTVPRGFTAYTYLCGCYLPLGFVPKHSLARLAKLAKLFRDNNVIGIYRCGLQDLYGTEGHCYYIYNRLLQDGSANVEALLADYCGAAFGPAAGHLRCFYETQDARLRMFDKIAEGFNSEGIEGLDGFLCALPKKPIEMLGLLFSPAAIKDMETCLSAAERTEGLSEKQRNRLALVRMEFDYAKRMGTVATLYAAYQATCRMGGGSSAYKVPLMDAIRERNSYLDRIFDGGKVPQPIEGWPELKPFGRYCNREMMNVNGCSSARILEPLTWK